MPDGSRVQHRHKHRSLLIVAGAQLRPPVEQTPVRLQLKTIGVPTQAPLETMAMPHKKFQVARSK